MYFYQYPIIVFVPSQQYTVDNLPDIFMGLWYGAEYRQMQCVLAADH